MLAKSITLVAGTEQTRIALTRQLKEYLSDFITLHSYAVDEGISEKITNEIVVLSSDLVKEELLNSELLDKKCDVIIAQRSISYDWIG